MTHESTPIGAYLAAGATSAALCIAEHMVVWPERTSWPLVARYTAGVLAIGAGVEVGCLNGASARGAFWTAALCSGAAVGIAHLFRRIETKRRLETLINEVRRGL